MARVVFAEALQRHVACPPVEAQGSSVREVLDRVFEVRSRARGYVLDDQMGLRKHMNIFVDGRPVKDRRGLTDAVGPQSEIYILQSLSGG